MRLKKKTLTYNAVVKRIGNPEATNLVLLLYKKYKGEANTITTPALCGILGISPPILRKYVNLLRTNGYPVCSGKNGYWYAVERREVVQTILNLKGRSENIEEAIHGLESII